MTNITTAPIAHKNVDEIMDLIVDHKEYLRKDDSNQLLIPMEDTKDLALAITNLNGEYFIAWVRHADGRAVAGSLSPDAPVRKHSECFSVYDNYREVAQKRVALVARRSILIDKRG